MGDGISTHICNSRVKQIRVILRYALHYLTVVCCCLALGRDASKTYTLNAMGCVAMRAQRNTMLLQGRVLMHCATHYIILPWFTAAWHWGGAHRKTYTTNAVGCIPMRAQNERRQTQKHRRNQAPLSELRCVLLGLILVLHVLLSLSPLENIHGALLARAAFVRGPRVCPAAAPSPIPAAGTTHCGTTGSSFTLICLRVLLIS